MRKILWILVGVALVGWILYSNIQQQRENKSDTRHFVLDLAPRTGPAGALSKYLHQGYQLALADIKEKYGDIILLQEEDHGGNSQKAITDFTKYKKNDMSLIIEWSGPTKAITPLLDGSFITLATGVSYPGITNPKKSLFRVYIDSASIMPEVVKQIKSKGFSNAAILSFDDDYGLGSRTQFVEAFEKVGGKIIADERFTLNQREIRNQIYKVLTHKPEAIFVTGYGQTYISLFQMLHDQEYKGLIVADWPLTCPEFYEPLGKNVNGIIVVAPRFNKRLVKMYEELYHKKGYLTNVAYGYDTLMLIAKSLMSVREGKSKNMTEAMSNIKEYSGFSGTFKILEDGNITNDITAYIFKNGELVPLESETK